MAAIFTPRHGYVAILTEDVEVGVVCPGYARPVTDFEAPETLKCIVTRVSLNMPENFQFQHSLDRLIYTYVFGSRISEATISGVAFALDCAEGPQGAGGTDAFHGIERLLQYYKQYRISQRAPSILFTVGVDTAFDGFITGMNADVLDPKIDLYQFSMRIHFDPAGV